MSNPNATPEPAPVIAEPFLFGILGLGIVNGIFSPLTQFVILFRHLWYPDIFLPSSFQFVAMFASLIVSTLSIMVAGIPAALYERFLGNGRTSEVSLWIWVSALALISMPAVLNGLARL